MELNIMNNTFVDNFFRDGNGEIVIGQMPNLPITVWVVATLLKFVYKTGKVNLGLDLLASSALFVWAIEELFQGVNHFRQWLGLFVLIGLTIAKIQEVSINNNRVG
jgi:hypothetical protein